MRPAGSRRRAYYLVFEATPFPIVRLEPFIRSIRFGNTLRCSRSPTARSLILPGERGGTRTLDPMIDDHEQVPYFSGFSLPSNGEDAGSVSGKENAALQNGSGAVTNFNGLINCD